MYPITLDRNLSDIATASRGTPRSLEVCGQAESGKKVIDKVAALKPDIVILDASPHGMDGLEASCEMRRMAPSTKTLMFTYTTAPHMLFRQQARMVTFRKHETRREQISGRDQGSYVGSFEPAAFRF